MMATKIDISKSDEKKIDSYFNKYSGQITCAFQDDLYVDSEGNDRCIAKRTQEREKYLFPGFKEDHSDRVVLIECPKDMLAIEFETHDKKGEKHVDKDQLKRWIEMTCQNAVSHNIDYCVCDHGGTSPYFYACNIDKLIENNERECKKEIVKLIVPEEAIDFVDFSNLGNTLIPIINKPHWKRKYKGTIHTIIDGKLPHKHKNKIPDIALQRVIENTKPQYDRVHFANDSDIQSINITDVTGYSGLKKRGSEWQGVNPWHGSGTGMNFTLSPSQNIWHCFRCASGGGVAKAIGLQHGIINSCDQNLSSDQFKNVLQIAYEKYGLKKPEPEELIKKAKEETSRYRENEINFVDVHKGQSWTDLKRHCSKLMRLDEDERLFFLAHSEDKIAGKAQLIHDTLQKIPLVTRVVSKNKEGEEVTSFKFIDETYDKRYDGSPRGVMAVDFWIYRVIHEGKEYFLFSQERLGNEMYTFEGMSLELNNFSEATKTLKFRSLSTIFIVKKAYPSIRSMKPAELVEVGQTLKEKYNINHQSLIDYIFTSPRDNKIYDYSRDFNMLQIAQLFSGKEEGYPLHIMKMGPVGTGKTTLLECLDAKFQERTGILEAGNSTPKALVPSFKEKPASPGYVMSCYRFALVDELMKMISNSSQVARYMELMQQSLGQLNMLLEQKERTIGSGNDNSFTGKSTAKVLFSTNPLPNKTNIYQHIGPIDGTTLSRMLVWIQDEEEQNKVYREKAEIKENKNTYSILDEGYAEKEKNKNTDVSIYPTGGSEKKEGDIKVFFIGEGGGLNTYGGVFINFNDLFLSIYDSCQLFHAQIDRKKVQQAYKAVTNLAKEPMRQVWESRGIHHTFLILDGLVKFRCIFRDFDETYTAIDEDYDNLERILTRMVKNWDVDMSPKREFAGF